MTFPADAVSVGRAVGGKTSDTAQTGQVEVRTIAIGRTPKPGHEQLFVDYGRFRGWVYTVANKIMATDALDANGTDFDRYDDHAVHLAAIATVSSDGVIDEEVVGVSRLIVDVDDESNPYVAAGLRPGLGLLPVETHFPALASTIDLRDARVRCEVSRYAASSKGLSERQRVSLALRRGIVQHFINAGGQEAYAVLERPLADRLRRDGVALEEITEARLLPEYGSVNFGVSLDLQRLAEDMNCSDTVLPPFEINVGVHDAVRP